MRGESWSSLNLNLWLMISFYILTEQIFPCFVEICHSNLMEFDRGLSALQAKSGAEGHWFVLGGLSFWSPEGASLSPVPSCSIPSPFPVPSFFLLHPLACPSSCFPPAPSPAPSQILARSCVG